MTNFECIVRKQVEAGDHITFFKEIVMAYQNEKAVNRIYNFSGDGVFAPAVKTR